MINSLHSPSCSAKARMLLFALELNYFLFMRLPHYTIYLWSIPLSFDVKVFEKSLYSLPRNGSSSTSSSRALPAPPCRSSNTGDGIPPQRVDGPVTPLRTCLRINVELFSLPRLFPPKSPPNPLPISPTFATSPRRRLSYTRGACPI